MTKRTREEEEDEELAKLVISQIRKIKKNPTTVEPPSSQETLLGKKSIFVVGNLKDSLEDILKNVIREDGFTIQSDKDGLVQFQGVILHPFEMTYDLLKLLRDCGQKYQGSLWIDFEPHDQGTVIKAYFTQEASLIMAKTKKDQIEDLHREQETKIDKPPTDELGILGHSLVRYLDVDRLQRPKFKTRPTGGSLFVVNCTVVLEKGVSSRQIERVFQSHAENIKSLTWGKHLTLPKLFISLEVGSPTSFPETVT